MPRQAGRTSHPAARHRYVNRYGRRGGRGWRPWLLLPKSISVAVWVGGLASLTVIAWSCPARSSEAQFIRCELAQSLFWMLLTPALALSIGLGVLLTLQHPRAFITMRWWMLKIALALGALLPFWGVLAWTLHRLHVEPIEAALVHQLRWALAGALLVTLLMFVLGRLKPRCGQNPARTQRMHNGGDK